MKKNVLFSLCALIFSFVFSVSDVNAEAVKKCDYSKPLTSISCNENQIFSVVTIYQNGNSCNVVLKDQNGNQTTTTINGDSQCSNFAVQYSSENTCYVYKCNDIWVEEDNYSNSGVTYNTCTISCGIVKGIPENLPVFTRKLVNIIKVLIPVILIILGIVDFLRATTSNDEKTMAESPKRFVRRIIASVLVFLVISFIQIVVRLISDASINSGDDKNPVDGVTECISCFISDKNACGEPECK